MAARSIVEELAPSFGSTFSRAWSITCIFWSSTAAGELGPGALAGAGDAVGGARGATRARGAAPPACGLRSRLTGIYRHFGQRLPGQLRRCRDLLRGRLLGGRRLPGRALLLRGCRLRRRRSLLRLRAKRNAQNEKS